MLLSFLGVFHLVHNPSTLLASEVELKLMSCFSTNLVIDLISGTWMVPHLDAFAIDEILSFNKVKAD